MVGGTACGRLEGGGSGRRVVAILRRNRRWRSDRRTVARRALSASRHTCKACASLDLTADATSHKRRGISPSSL